mmetsp:Transcript_37081/g.112068  ORF Transcript_37081/g.112068 Transcript_37081/m.112068 type:complete len:286 (-) Transcript_37081:2282-3139(-)
MDWILEPPVIGQVRKGVVEQTHLLHVDLLKDFALDGGARADAHLRLDRPLRDLHLVQRHLELFGLFDQVLYALEGRVVVRHVERLGLLVQLACEPVLHGQVLVHILGVGHDLLLLHALLEGLVEGGLEPPQVVDLHRAHQLQEDLALVLDRQARDGALALLLLLPRLLLCLGLLVDLERLAACGGVHILCQLGLGLLVLLLLQFLLLPLHLERLHACVHFGRHLLALQLPQPILRMRVQVLFLHQFHHLLHLLDVRALHCVGHGLNERHLNLQGFEPFLQPRDVR